MENVDWQREQAGAADLILRTLAAFGFEWDGAVMRQTERVESYARALARLDARGALFACSCTRKELADSALTFDGERVYPGTCRSGLPEGRTPRAIRVRVSDEVIAFDDAIQGAVVQILERDVGDFVVRRGDGLYAYQHAVVVDDAEQGVTEVVRGADLLASTPRQIYLQRLLGVATPRYAHLPAAVDARGDKLSKQTLARPLEPARAARTLAAALEFLGQEPPPDLADGVVGDVWAWALPNWRLDKVPRQRTRLAPPGM